MPAIAKTSLAERAALCEFIGERADAVLSLAALRSGHGRVWFEGDALNPAAVLVESALVPGEPQGFGQCGALLELLSVADAWTCVEVPPTLADDISGEFDQRWGLARSVADVVHELTTPAQLLAHPLVRRVSAAEAETLDVASPDVLPDRALVVAAATVGRVFAAVVGEQIVGHGSSMAASSSFADVGVHVAEPFRGQGIAAAAASLACRAVQEAGLTPVWGAGSDNVASIRVAEKIGFREVTRLVFLVRAS